ncbi:MAG: hypothetical protein R2717_06670 [Schumannella sp.]
MNEAIERHIDSLQSEDIDDPASLSDAAWNGYMSAIDRDIAFAQITSEWAIATSTVNMRAGKARSLTPVSRTGSLC